MDPYIQFFVGVRWTDHERVLQLFDTMGQYVERLRGTGRGEEGSRRARTLAAYVRPFYHLCCAVVPGVGGALIPALDALDRTGCIVALGRGSAAPRCLGRSLRAVYPTDTGWSPEPCRHQFTAGGPWAPLLPTWASWAPIRRCDIPLFPPQRRLRRRDRFTDDEIARLRRATEASPRDHGLLLFFLSRGVVVVPLPPLAWRTRVVAPGRRATCACRTCA